MTDMLDRFNFKLVNAMNVKKASRDFLTKERYDDLLKANSETKVSRKNWKIIKG